LIGWIISKIRFKRYIRKLDKKVLEESKTERFKELKLEQETADKYREKNQDQRRIKLLKQGIDLKSKTQEVKSEDIEIEENDDKWEEF
jgi:AAA15 family ATPase/GTPase